MFKPLCTSGLLLTLLLVACSSRAQELRLQLKWFHQFQSAGFYAADIKGYYAEEGIDIVIVEGGPGVDVIAAVNAGHAELGVIGADLLSARLSGAPVVAVAPIFQHSPYVLLSLPSHPVRSPREIQGTRISASGGRLPIEFQVLLATQGIAPGSYSIVPSRGGTPELLAVEVEVASSYITDQPFQLMQQGIEPVYLEPLSFGVDFYGDTVFTSEAVAAAQPDRVAAFRRATLRGWAYALAHPDELIEYILALETQRPAPQSSEALVFEASRLQQVVVPNLVELGHSSPARWQRMGESLVEHGFAKELDALEGFLFDPGQHQSTLLRVLTAGLLALLCLLLAALVVLIWHTQVRRFVRVRTSLLEDQTRAMEEEIRERREMEARLRRLADIIEATPDFVGMCDLNGVGTYLNQSGRIMVGIGPDEDITKFHFSDLQHERERERFMEEVLPQLREQGVWQGIVSLAGRGGREVPASQIIIGHKDEAGELKYFSTIARDISLTRQAELALRESRRTLLTLVRNLPGMAYRCANDPRWTMEFVSGGSQELTGYRPDEIIGNRIVSFSSLIHEEEREAIWEQVQEALEERRAFQLGYRLRTRDNEIKWVWEQGRGVFTKKGTLLAIEGFIIDVTHRRNAEEAMNQLRLYMKNVIDAMPSIIAGVDFDGRVTLWNLEAELKTGIREEEAQGASIADVLPVVAPELDRIRHAIRERKTLRREKMRVEGSNSVQHFDLMVYPLTEVGNEGAVVRVDDVTQRVRLEEVVVQSEKMMLVGGLAAGMAHEINNPLGGILQAYNNIIRRTSPGLPDNVAVATELGFDVELIREYFQRRSIDTFLANINEACNRAARIVADMLAFSRAGESHYTHVRAEELLQTAVRWARTDIDLKHGFEDREVQIVVDCEPRAGELWCDAAKIQQVLLNLIRNAVQALQSENASLHPMISLRAFDAGASVRIEVVDNGPGMTEEARRRVFEPFFTTKEIGIGTGLGLSVSYFLIVDQHHGTIEVRSQPAQGATFIITIPREPASRPV